MTVVEDESKPPHHCLNFSIRKQASKPHGQWILRGAPGENSQLVSLAPRPRLDGRRAGGVRFAEPGETSVPGRCVLPGGLQLVILRRQRGNAWNLVGGRGADAPLAQATKVPGRRRFVLRTFGEAGGVSDEFILDGERRGLRVLVYRRDEECDRRGKEAPLAIILWGLFGGGNGIGSRGTVRSEADMEVDTLHFCVWLSMLLWRKRPVGGRNECLDGVAAFVNTRGVEFVKP